MILKFIFILCVFFSIYDSFHASPADNTYLNSKKLRPLIEVTASGAFISKQSDNSSLKINGNIFSDSPNSVNSSSIGPNVTPQAYLSRKNIDTEKENKVTPLHEYPPLVEITSTVAKNADFPSNNQTLVGESHQVKSKKFKAVDKSREADNVTSRIIIRYDKMIEDTSTKASALHRIARAKTESVQSVLKKIFPDHFIPQKDDSDFDGSSNENYKSYNSPRRRQMTKKLKTGRFGGEVAYFRADDEVTTAAGGADTTAGATVGAETTGNATGGAETAGGATGGAETTGNATGGAETTGGATGGAETTTNATGGANTSAPAAGDAQTAPPGSGGAETSSVPAEGTTGENKTLTSTSVDQQVNYHYHFHYFGGIPGNAAPTPPGKETTTEATTAHS